LKKSGLSWITFLTVWIFHSSLWSQTVPLSSPPQDFQVASAGDPTPQTDKGTGEPFKPNWEWQVQLSDDKQQAGQNTTTFSFTGIRNISEKGNYYSFFLDSARQKVEGVQSVNGTVGLQGGLVLGGFSPSLSIGAQYGDSDLRGLTTNLAADFKLSDPFTLNLLLGGSLSNHRGNLSEIAPQFSSDNLWEIDLKTWDSGLGLTWTASDLLSLSGTFENQYEITYQIRSIDHSLVYPLNQSDRILSFTLGMDFALSKSWTLEVAPQLGKEYTPAGSTYSPLTGGIVYFSSPTTQNFIGGTASIGFSFE